MTLSIRRRAPLFAAATLLLSHPALALAQAFPPPLPVATAPDGAHDFDFLIGDWKAHLKRLPDRLVGSTAWVEYDGTSKTHKILSSDANIEDFDVDDAKDHLHIHAQALRLYNPVSHQWSVYGLDLDKGDLSLPATIGQFTNGRSELFDYEAWKGRWVLVHFQWSHTGLTKATWSRPSRPTAAGAGS